MSNTFTTKLSGKVSSRAWALGLGIAAIVLASVLLIVYLDRYRARVGGGNVPTPVLVAKQTIPVGTPGTVVTSGVMYEDVILPKKEVEAGAIADPTYFNGRAAAAEILPGQQITAASFAASPTTHVDSQITGTQRAISVSIDSVHGSLPQLQAGDSIDLYLGLGTGAGGQQYRLFRPNVKVLAVPGPEGGSIVLRVDTRDAADFAYAADNTQMYFVIRPVANAKPTVRDTATALSLTR
jgi:Flp pilus assembly protein CpaB